MPYNVLQRDVVVESDQPLLFASFWMASCNVVGLSDNSIAKAAFSGASGCSCFIRDFSLSAPCAFAFGIRSSMSSSSVFCVCAFLVSFVGFFVVAVVKISFSVGWGMCCVICECLSIHGKRLSNGAQVLLTAAKVSSERPGGRTLNGAFFVLVHICRSSPCQSSR